MRLKGKWNYIISFLIILLLFFLFSYLIQKNLAFFQEKLGDNIPGMTAYALLGFLATVFAPINTFPLIPAASKIWGWKIAGILHLVGWLAGAVVAFVIARKFGVPIVKKFASLQQIRQIESMVSNKTRFWGIVTLRIIIPVDVLSYALGLFSKISLRDYILASLIGIAPFAFILAYVGEQSLLYQLIAISLILVLLAAAWIFEFPKIRRQFLQNLNKK